MKAIVTEKVGSWGLREVPAPVPPPGWALIKVRAAAFCATDIEVLDGGIPAKYPLIQGHEWCGEVVTINGSDQALVGKRVVGSNDVCCLTCPACRRGLWRQCPSFGEIGFKHDGAYAEYMLAPAYALIALPDSIGDIQAAMLEPLGVALGTLDKADVRLGETLLILGSGSIGLNVLAAAKAAGMRRIAVVERTGGRLKIARDMGASYALASAHCDIEQALREIYPAGPDVIVDCTGAQSCVRLALSIAPKGGRVALAGYGGGRETTWRMDDVHVKNLRVVGAGNNWDVLGRAVELVADGLVSTERLCTLTMPIERFDDAVRAARAREPGFVKAVFTFGSGA